MSRLILASQSMTRQVLLKAAGVEFRVMAAGINERAVTESLLAQGVEARDVARTLAEQKALAVSRAHPDATVLGTDSVLALGEELIEKSPDLAALKGELRRLSGKTHRLISAAALARGGTPLWHHVDEARMAMRELSDAFLDDYLAREGEALLASVGGYRFEGLGAQLFASVQGDYFTILGLPLLPVLKELRAQGWLQA